MTQNEVIELMLNEVACIKTAHSNQCSRDCANCELVKETSQLLQAYNIVIKSLSEIREEYEVISTVEEFKALKAENEEVLLKDGQLLYLQGLVDGYDKAITEFVAAYKKSNLTPRVFARIFKMVQFEEADLHKVAEEIDKLYYDSADRVARDLKASKEGGRSCE